MNVFKQVTVADRQSLVDIAMQEYGCYEGIFTLLDDNMDRLKAIDEVPIPGMKLNVRVETPRFSPGNRTIVLEYSRLLHTVIGNAVGVSHIYSTVSSYVATDYIAPSYTAPPQELLNVIATANITKVKMLPASTNKWE